jgi:hypothetical protein
MADVSVGYIGFVTLKPRPQGSGFVTIWNTGPPIGPFGGGFNGELWYRAGISLDLDNSPGTTVVIGDTGTSPDRFGEAFWVDDNGQVNVALTVVNTGTSTASLSVTWLTVSF